MPFSWKQTTWCGKHIPLSCPHPYLSPKFSVYRHCPQDASSSSNKKATLKLASMLWQVFIVATLAATTFSASSSSGQPLSTLPACAVSHIDRLFIDQISLTPSIQQSCLQNATAVQGSCSPVDISCLCSSSLYQNTLACCLSKNCNQADQTCTQTLNEESLIVC